ncbi:cell division regulator GpsB [Abyssicoccus albus]|uniref:DivIVA domain-containing protein n=1 Tax=Abyssicoccus albus TaxID=1817405 RepID=A0A3N5CD23_9BACL|nr:cell division regulator GpsB [Abyssicoccus albus]RPF58002.1 DivIVA domain-containing protein [Abyssicoccus albus]
MSNFSLKLTAKDIYEKEFERTLRGFKPEEVDSFLDDVIADYQKMSELDSKVKKLEEENLRLKKELDDVKLRSRSSSQSDQRNTASINNVDILKRLSNLEKQVFGRVKE